MKFHTIKIARRSVGEGRPAFFIADIGSNHDGSLSQAKLLIDKAKAAGADCVKFQSFRADELVSPGHPMFGALRKLELSEEWHYKLASYSKKKGIMFTSTPFHLEAVDILQDIGVPFYKIASGDITYEALLKKVAKTKRPMVISSGSSYLHEVEKAITLIRKYNNRLIILHCVSLYPPDPSHINLRCIKTMSQALKRPVGLSDHSRSLAVILGAVAMGASVIERHLTLSRRLKGFDHPFSVEPDEFKEMVASTRELELAMGSPVKRPHPAEAGFRRAGRRKKIIVNGEPKYLRPLPR